MNFKEHATAGAVVSVPVFFASHYFFQDLNLSVTLALSVFGGSLSPDLDTDSTPSKIVGKILFTYLLIALLEDYTGLKHWLLNIRIPAWLAVIFLGFKLDAHRGFTHKYTFPLFFTGVMLYTQYLWFGAFALGIVVHYIVDKIYPWRLRSWF